MEMIEYQDIGAQGVTVYIAEAGKDDDVAEDEGRYTLWWGPELVHGYESLEQAREDMRKELTEKQITYAPIEGGGRLPSAGMDREVIIGLWREADEDDDEYEDYDDY